MKKIFLFAVVCFSCNAFAYEFMCNVELYNSGETKKLTLTSENESIQPTFRT